MKLLILQNKKEKVNKISDTEIKNILRIKCEEIKKQIGEDRLFGIFVIGPAWYGIAEITNMSVKGTNIKLLTNIDI